MIEYFKYEIRILVNVNAIYNAFLKEFGLNAIIIK